MSFALNVAISSDHRSVMMAVSRCIVPRHAIQKGPFVGFYPSFSDVSSGDRRVSGLQCHLQCSERNLLQACEPPCFLPYGVEHF